MGLRACRRSLSLCATSRRRWWIPLFVLAVARGRPSSISRSLTFSGRFYSVVTRCINSFVVASGSGMFVSLLGTTC